MGSEREGRGPARPHSHCLGGTELLPEPGPTVVLIVHVESCSQTLRKHRWDSFSLSFKITFYWRIIPLQCVTFYCIAKWISQIDTRNPSLLDFLPSQVSTEHWAELPVLRGRVSWLICLHWYRWAAGRAEADRHRAQICGCHGGGVWEDQRDCSQDAQSSLHLCDPVDCSPPGVSVHGIFQARILEWVAISFARGSFWPRDQPCVFGVDIYTLLVLNIAIHM